MITIRYEPVTENSSSPQTGYFQRHRRYAAIYTMPEFTVSDGDLATLSGKVVVVTGCSSGIGLAAVKELLKVGAKVVGGDLSDPKSAIDSQDFTFAQVNVTDWKALCNLFKHAINKFGHIDHVFANAGAYCPRKYSPW